MRLLVDLQGCQNNSRHRGIGRTSLALGKALLRQAGGDEVFVLLNSQFEDTIEPLRHELAGLMPTSRILLLDVPGPIGHLRAENAQRRIAAEMLREDLICDLDPDAVLVMSMVEGSEDDTVSSVGWLGGRPLTVALLHDLIPLLDPERYIGAPDVRRWYLDKVDSLRRCDLLLAVSASAAREAIDALGIGVERVVSISSAADEKFEHAVVEREALTACHQRLGIDRPYLMHAGAVEARKNFDGLVRAYAALGEGIRRSHQLVLAGKASPESMDALRALACSLGIPSQDLVLTGHVTDDDLIALYAGCHLFVYPSFHEGFGLPALEAMHFGVPVIGSRATSIPEVIGREDALFDPASVDEMAALIRRCLVDKEFRGELASHAKRRAKAFSWDASARAALASIRKAVAERDGRQRRDEVMDGAARRQLLGVQLALAPGRGRPSFDELVPLARSVAIHRLGNELASAHAMQGPRLSWRIEGPFDSSYSLAIVNREFARALAALGHEVVLHATEGPGDFSADDRFLAANADLAAMHATAPSRPPETCDVTSRNLYPPRVTDLKGPVKLLHQYAWEESGMPAAWVEDFNRSLQGITCTSEHVKKVLIDNGVHVPIAVVGNGIDHWDRIEPSSGRRFGGKRFRFLHVSSCFPRKGVDVLLQAFGDAFTLDDDVSLLIKTFPNPHNKVHELLADCRARSARFPDVQILEEDLPDDELRALYEQCDVFVAPSRAEGFGLPLAEAMLSGLPVITTAWGGALDFCSATDAWLLDYRFAPADSHIGLSDSVWAEPDRAALGRLLRRAFATTGRERQRRAESGRAALLQHFAWKHVAARAIGAARRWQRGAPAATAPRVGWITTWNTRCGIAAYARHIAGATGQVAAVLAPIETELVSPDEDHVHRCWVSGKQGNRLDLLGATIRRLALDVLVVQFNYAFFAFDALADFLTEQADEGRVIIVMLHATHDPASLAAEDENWQLRTLRPGLLRCSRLLVHTIADLNRLKTLGLADFATLFPHPVWTTALPPVPPARPLGGPPVIATFGYCLPHKGLSELLHAVALLKQRGVDLELRMLNAEYPADVSRSLVDRLRGEIRELGLSGRVDLCSDYLDEPTIASRLSDVDLIVYPYQCTDESASGAIRQAMAMGRPVLVTPLPIFDELAGSVHRCDGLDAPALAAGLHRVLEAISARSPEALEVANLSDRWREQRSLSRLARRLASMTRALHRDRPTAASRIRWALDGSSRLFRSECGTVMHRELVASGKAGVLLRGPGAVLGPGQWEARLLWSTAPGIGYRYRIRDSIETSHALAEGTVEPGQFATLIPFRLHRRVVGLDVEIEVPQGFAGTLSSLILRPMEVAP